MCVTTKFREKERGRERERERCPKRILSRCISVKITSRGKIVILLRLFCNFVFFLTFGIKSIYQGDKKHEIKG